MTMSYAVDEAALIDLAFGLARTPSVSGHEEAAVKLAASAACAPPSSCGTTRWRTGTR